MVMRASEPCEASRRDVGKGEGARGRFHMQILEMQLSPAYGASVWKLTFSLFS